MNIHDVNEMSSDIFINLFKNIFEKTPNIAVSSANHRPFKDKKHLIEIFINEFQKLNKETKKNIIKKHPDLGNKLKINNHSVSYTHLTLPTKA